MGKLLVVSHDHTMFTSRLQAAERLAELLVSYRGGDTIVVGIARGGVILADLIADRLGADMDVTVSRKIHLRGENGPVVGVLSEDAQPVLLKAPLSWLQPSSLEVKQQIYLAGIYMRVARNLYRGVRPPAPLEGRTVIVVDDGLVTGATMAAVLNWIQSKHPSQVVVAVPLGPEDSVGELSDRCDELLCFSVPVSFTGLADYYEHFPVVDERRVLAALQRHYDDDLIGGSDLGDSTVQS